MHIAHLFLEGFLLSCKLCKLFAECLGLSQFKLGGCQLSQCVLALLFCVSRLALQLTQLFVQTVYFVSLCELTGGWIVNQ